MDRPIAIAILAMGGQGGGVLSDWIVALAEREGFAAQSTYVAGVAQRTGATLYYIEMMRGDGRQPVFALNPAPGDVDVVLAAEWMEAGRSILRGLVTPDRTTLIASTHRALAVSEKEKPSRAIADGAAVIAAAGIAAKRIVAFDMDALARAEGSVISAALFGALAGAGVLPFAREAFEAVISVGAKGAAQSLAAFAAAYAEAQAGKPAPVAPPPSKDLKPLPISAGHADLDRLIARIRAEFAEPVQTLVFAGAERLADYQDAAYAAEYLTRLGEAAARDSGAREWRLTLAAAKALAAAMAYDDPIRIADLKTRASRFARVRAEVGAEARQVVQVTEFMHPRMEEFLGSLPSAWADFIEGKPWLRRFAASFFGRGRRIRTDSLRGFLTLYLTASLRSRRRQTRRHAVELAHIGRWFGLGLAQPYDLAVEVFKARKLVKGYSDTHARGLSKFDRVMSAVPALAPRGDAAEWLSRLTRAAELDEDGEALGGALKTIATLEETTA